MLNVISKYYFGAVLSFRQLTLLSISISTFLCSSLIGMDMISLEGKTNFFEKRVAEYQKSGVMASIEGKDGKIDDLDFDAEF